MNKNQFGQWLRDYAQQPELALPLTMGILNRTPDSFSDGGKFSILEKALQQVRAMCREGVDLIDIGGESSRPGFTPISVDEELDRVIPLIEKLRAETDICLSLDTTKPEVMKAGIEFGVDVINDISALANPQALHLVAENKMPVCIMHNGNGANSSLFFETTLSHCIANGIKPENIIIDPGFGFGKTTKDNLTVIKYLKKLRIYGYPILVGFSRKSSLGTLVKQPVNQRVYAGVAMTILAWQQGARIFRTHDILATRHAFMVALAIEKI